MPDYNNIYSDIILEKFPEKMHQPEIKNFFSKSQHSSLEIIRINEFIYNQNYIAENQTLRSYDKISILKILKYQKQHHLTNSYISIQYKLSRNTIAQWKKWFLDEVE